MLKRARDLGLRDRRKRTQHIGHLTVVGERRIAGHPELQQLVAAPLRQQPVVRLAPVALRQPVFEIQNAAGAELREVDDHLVAFGHRDHEAHGASQWARQQPTFGCDHVHRKRLAARVSVVEEDAIDPGIRGVQETEAVLPPLDLEVRLNRAVDHELVAEETVVIERAEDQRAVGSEALVLKSDRNVVRRARKPERRRIRIVLGARVELVEAEHEAGQAAIGVRTREVEQVIVVPLR